MSPKPQGNCVTCADENVNQNELELKGNVQVNVDNSPGAFDLEDALEQIGVGKYAYIVLVVTCYSTIAASMEPFGIGLVATSAQCDLQLDTFKKGIISAVPMLGIILSSHTWGYIADTRGRRFTMLIAFAGSCIFGLVSSFVADWITLIVMKLLSVVFACGASAVVYAFVVEQVPRSSRNKFMMMVSTSLMLSQILIAVAGFTTLRRDFAIPLSPLPLVYRPWRLLCQVFSLFNFVAMLMFLFCVYESPKFYLSQGKEKEALAILKMIYAINTGKEKEDYPVKSLTMSEDTNETRTGGLLNSMWSQTAPLFHRLYIKKTLIIVYISIVTFSATPPVAIWMPHIINAYTRATPTDNSQDNFCSRVVAQLSNITSQSVGDAACNDSIDDEVLYTMMKFGGTVTCLGIVCTLILRFTSKKVVTIILNCLSATACVALVNVSGEHAITVYLLIAVNAIVMGIVPAFAVEIYPTYLRSMAVCLTIMVGRGMSFVSINLMGLQIEQNCTKFFYGFGGFIISAAIVGCFLPADQKKKNANENE